MKLCKRLFTLVLCALFLAALAPFAARAEERPKHAPNMYIDWPDNGSYDVMTVDWYCEQDATNTYWAVHNWDGGYAGFQNKDGGHVLLMSLWDMDNGTRPTIEYALDGKNGDFGGEGTGKQVFTNYAWQVGKWYTMRVQVWTENGKSYFGQWICERGGSFIKTAVISYPVKNMKFDRDSMFQEDFDFNNSARTCRLTNAYGRFYDTKKWDSWSHVKLCNTYFPTTPATWDNVCWNVDYDCDWGVGSDSSYVWVQSGGGAFASNGKKIPVSYTVKQAKTPAWPDWISADEAQGAGGGSAALTEADKAVNDALETALKSVKARGKAAGAANVIVDFGAGDGAEHTVVLSQNARKSLIGAGIGTLTLNGGDSAASVTLGLKALKAVQKQLGGDVTVKLTAVSALSSRAEKLIGDRPVFGVAIGGEKRGKPYNFTSLSGTNTIIIPYTLRPDETAENVFGVSVDAKGNAKRVKGSRYDAASGCLIIPLGKLSLAYGVGGN